MTENQNNFIKKILIWGLPLLVLVAGFVISSAIRNSRPEVAIVTQAKQLTVIRGIVAQKTSFLPTIHAQGTVKAKQQIELVPEVAGKIIWMSPAFADGGLYKSGDILLKIDPRNYEFAVARAQASVAEARNTLTLEKAEADLAKTEWEELGGGEASALVLREPQMESARAKLSSAEADLERALLDLERTKLKAPFEGRVEEKKVGIGQYVTLGTPLAVLFSTDVAEISLPLTDSDLGKLDLQVVYSEENRLKQSLDVTLSAQVGGLQREWIGQVVRVAGTVDINSRVLSVIIEVDNPFQVRAGGAPLLNGLFVEAAIPGRVLQDVFLLPRSALYNQSQVVIIDQDDTMRSRDIEILHSNPDQVVVRGLSDGERVNVSALDVLIEGTKVHWTLAEGEPQ